MLASPTAAPSHRLEPHTADVMLHLEAPTLEALFVEAGRALAEVLAEEPPAPGPEEERVEVEARDRAGLLVAWLDELVFLSETRHRVLTDFAFDTLEEGRLVARVRGGEPATLRTAVKAATFYRLLLEERPEGGFRARVVLDV